MVVKNTKNKNKKFNYLRAGIRIRKTRKMVEVEDTVFPNKDSPMTKVNIPPIKTHSPMKKRIKTHSPMKTVKYNLSKGFKWSKVEQGGAKWSKVKKRKNRVCKDQNLVNNYEDKMDNR